MKYIITEKFGPGNEKWNDYAHWAGLQACQEFYSIDGIMRGSLFLPESEEDWDNCVNENFKTHIITTLDFAKQTITKFTHAEIIGVIQNPKYSDKDIPIDHEFVGYDIIDGQNGISLLTNWGGVRQGTRTLIVNKSGLIDTIDDAYQVKETLRRDFSEDPHANHCEVWAIYKVKA